MRLSDNDRIPHRVNWCKARKPEHEYELKTTIGECLERAGLPYKTKAVINRTELPNVGDLVWVDNSLGTIHGFIKRVKSFDDGVLLVETAYDDPNKDFMFYATTYYGVIEMAFDYLGDVVYRRGQAPVPTIEIDEDLSDIDEYDDEEDEYDD